MKPYYKDDKVTIYHAKYEECLSEMADKSVDLVVTSPRYNLVKEYSGGGPNSMLPMKKFETRLENWYEDTTDEEDYQKEQKSLLIELQRVCDGSIFYNHKIRYAIKRRGTIYHPMEWLKDFPVWTEIIWDRGGAIGGNSGRVLCADERIYQIGRPKVFNGAMGLTTIWRFPPAAPNGHPCPFPIALPARCIALATNEGDIVLDPNLGSGTTCLAAKNSGRISIGIEQDEKYCEMAAKRMSQEVLNFA